jgi:hypothetical protein
MSNPNLTFGVKSQNSTHPSNKSPPLVTGTINAINLGAVSAPISSNVFNGHTLSCAPVTAGQVYTLPTAAQILSEYGINLDSGIPKLTAGAMHNIHIINKGTSSAFVASNPTGGDGSAIIAYSPTGGSFNGLPLSTGATVPLGKLTNIYILWTNVASGASGYSGSYSVFQ